MSTEVKMEHNPFYRDFISWNLESDKIPQTPPKNSIRQ